MIAATPEMVEAMKQMGRPSSHEARGTYADFKPYERLTLTQVVDSRGSLEDFLLGWGPNAT